MLRGRKVRVLGSILLLLLAWPVTASGGQATLALLLSTQDSEPYRLVAQAFRLHFSKYFPGARFIDQPLVEENGQAPAPLSVEGAEVRPSLILALGTRAIEQAQQSFPETPLVASMILSKDKVVRHQAPVGAVTLQIPAAIQLQWLAKFLPGARRVGILYDPGQSDEFIKAFQDAAAGTGVQIVPVRVSDASHLQDGLQEISRQADVLLALPDATVYSGKTAKEVLLFAYRNRIPFVGLSSTWVEAGALYALEVDYAFIGQQCAESARQLLAGTLHEPSAPSAGNMTYTINNKTAQYLRLDLAPELLAGGREVYR